MTRKEKTENHKKARILCTSLTILFIGITCFLIYAILLLKPIEPFIRYIFITILILMIFRCLISRTLVIRNKKKKILFFSLKTIFFSILFLVISIYITAAYSLVDNFNKTKTNSKSGSINSPFTVLLMGVDTTSETLSPDEKGNSDTLIVLSFNPNTLGTTMLSIPRDSYVDITCMNKKNKITHAGWYGEECVENTIENFLDIDIDYYVKVNFKALIKIVDALGGIEVEVPKDLCTDNSDRKGQVCIKEGKQKLNGEEALVLARNRKQLANGDIDRGLNQQIVIKGILNAAGEKITDVSILYSLLETISNSIDTNFSTDQILSFYNIGKNIMQKSNKSITDSLTIRQLYLSGEGKYIYDTATKLNLYNYILYDESIEAVSDAINANLGKKDVELIKTFAWSIDENYKTTPIGKITNGTTSSIDDTTNDIVKQEEKEETKDDNNSNKSEILTTLPNFVGKNKSEVDEWCKSNNIYVSYSYRNVDSSYIQDQVLQQNVSAGTDIKTMASLKIVLANIKDDFPIEDDLDEDIEITN